LDLSNATKALKGLDNDEKSILKTFQGKKLNIKSPAGLNIVSFPGVIRLVWHSHKPEAKPFLKMGYP
jgi:prophage antirepressor-like protein